MRYIELDPIRAAMVGNPGECRWRSYGHNAHGKPDKLATLRPLYQALAESSIDRQHAYRELSQGHIEDEEVRVIRDALNQGLVLGRDDFKDKIGRITRRLTRPGKSGPP